MPPFTSAMPAKATALSRIIRTVAAAALAAFALGAPAAHAHAAVVGARIVDAIALHARYDTGEPMAGAQVVIYAPGDPTTPWSHGTTDADGRYLFAPDPEAQGRWTMQVRQAGHGGTAYVETGAGEGKAPGGTVTAGTEAYGPLQRAVTVLLVAWGAFGTVLFFWRRRGGHASP